MTRPIQEGGVSLQPETAAALAQRCRLRSDRQDDLLTMRIMAGRDTFPTFYRMYNRTFSTREATAAIELQRWHWRGAVAIGYPEACIMQIHLNSAPAEPIRQANV